MNCPVCNRPLPPPERNESGVERYFCDCAGFRRAVAEVIPESAAKAEPVNVKKKGLKPNDRSD